MFRALPCSSSGGLRRNCIYAINYNTVILDNSHLLSDDTYIQLRRRPPKMSRVMLETCKGF